MEIARIPLSGGAVLTVEIDRRGIVLSRPGTWRERLTREQALDLAEALDAAGSRRWPEAR